MSIAETAIWNGIDRLNEIIAFQYGRAGNAHEQLPQAIIREAVRIFDTASTHFATADNLHEKYRAVYESKFAMFFRKLRHSQLAAMSPESLDVCFRFACSMVMSNPCRYTLDAVKTIALMSCEDTIAAARVILGYTICSLTPEQIESANIDIAEFYETMQFLE